MNNLKLEYYDEFKCIASKCPYTCCKGWGVALDEDTIRNYKQEPGIKGLLLRFMIKDDKLAGKVIRKYGGKCPHCNSSNLCKFQLKDRMDLLPFVCRIYPRFISDYGDRREATFELSCYEAAKLFLENVNHCRLIETDEEFERTWEVRNDVAHFLELLRIQRDKINKYLLSNNKWSEYPQRINNIYKHAYVQNMILAEDKIDEAFKVELPANHKIYTQYTVPSIGEDNNCAFYPISFLNQIIYDKLSYPEMKKRNPFMYKLIGSYKKLYGKLRENEADNFFQGQIEEIAGRYPDFGQEVMAYMGYLINQTYCLSYENYYVLGPVLLAIMEVEYYMLFATVYYMKKAMLTLEDRAAIICNTEKIIRHNTTFDDYALQSIRNQFFR